MPIATTGSVTSTEPVPAGTQVEYTIRETTFDGQGKYGPSIELGLNITDERYYGTQLKYWARVQQPRLDLVRKYRADGMSDNLIKEALKERNFRFKKVDEPDDMVIGRSGNLYKILVATKGSPAAAQKVLEECDDFDQLAEQLVGGKFIGTTKKSADGQYTQLDGREEIYPVVAAPVSSSSTGHSGTTESDEDFETIPV